MKLSFMQNGTIVFEPILFYTSTPLNTHRLYENEMLAALFSAQF